MALQTPLITMTYVAAIAIVMAILSVRVGVLRGKYDVPLGDGDNSTLALVIRRFGNLAEYAAMALLLLLLMELKGVDAFWLHAYGTAFVVLRLLHPLVLFDDSAAPLWKKAGRFVSAAGTAFLMFAAALVLLIG